MDDLEFRKRATIEPGNQKPDFLKKMKQNKYNRHFVEEQLTFDQRLKAALNISVPENLNDRILLRQQLSQHRSVHTQNQHHLRVLLFSSFAASVLLAVSLFFIFTDDVKPINDSTVMQQIINHIHNDTHAMNVRMKVPKSSIDTMLASYGGRLKGPIGQVSFLGHCIIGEQTGIHLVLNTDHGLTTLLILPSQSINQQQTLGDPHFTGIVYPSRKGSIAIVIEKAAHRAESIHTLRQNIEKNLNWII